MDDEIGKLIEPPRISFSFNEPGWYALGLLCFILIILFVALWIRHKRKNAYRNRALRFLIMKENQTLENDLFRGLIYVSNNLMKRIAVKKYGRENVADKMGEDWIGFLNSSAKAEIFDQSDAFLLSQNLYESAKTDSSGEAGLFISKVKIWIQKHRNAL